MTGGIGFSSTGQNSIRQNRALKKPRAKMGDNPYAPSVKLKRKPGLRTYEAIKRWRAMKGKSEIKIRRLVIAAFLLLLVILILV